MKSTNNPNINSKTYWNNIYGTPEKRQEYASQGTSFADVAGNPIPPTQRFNRTLNEIKNGDTFLDIGCGVGVLTSMVKGYYPDCEVWGTDISDKAIEDNALTTPTIKYLHQYIGDQTELPDNYFDVVFSGEVLEHLDKPEDLFKDAYQVLKTRGKLIITTPLKNAIPSEEHLWEFDYPDIEKLFTDNGFSKPRFVNLPDMEHLMVIYAIGRKL